jgi:hypothetical protein
MQPIDPHAGAVSAIMANVENMCALAHEKPLRLATFFEMPIRVN